MFAARRFNPCFRLPRGSKSARVVKNSSQIKNKKVNLKTSKINYKLVKYCLFKVEFEFEDDFTSTLHASITKT